MTKFVFQPSIPDDPPQGGLSEAALMALTGAKDESSEVQALLAEGQASPPEPPQATERHVDDADWPSLDEVYDELKASVVTQADRIKALDTKVNYALAASSLLTAAVSALGRTLGDLPTASQPRVELVWWSVPSQGVADVLTVAALACFAAIIITTFASYRVRDFAEAPSPDRLVGFYLHEDPRETKAAIALSRAKAYNENETIINRKSSWLSSAMLLLVAEAVLVAGIGLLQAVVV